MEGMCNIRRWLYRGWTHLITDVDRPNDGIGDIIDDDNYCVICDGDYFERRRL